MSSQNQVFKSNKQGLAILFMAAVVTNFGWQTKAYAVACEKAASPVSVLKFDPFEQPSEVIARFKRQDKAGKTVRITEAREDGLLKAGILSVADTEAVLLALASAIRHTRNQAPLKGLEESIAEMGLNYEALTPDVIQNFVQESRFQGFRLVTSLSVLEAAVVKANWIPGKNDSALRTWRQSLIPSVPREFAKTFVEAWPMWGKPTLEEISPNSRIANQVIEIDRYLNIYNFVLTTLKPSAAQVIQFRNAINSEILSTYFDPFAAIRQNGVKTMGDLIRFMGREKALIDSPDINPRLASAYEPLSRIGGREFQSELLRALAAKLTRAGILNLTNKEIEGI